MGRKDRDRRPSRKNDDDDESSIDSREDKPRHKSSDGKHSRRSRDDDRGKDKAEKRSSSSKGRKHHRREKEERRRERGDDGDDDGADDDKRKQRNEVEEGRTSRRKRSPSASASSENDDSDSSVDSRKQRKKDSKKHKKKKRKKEDKKRKKKHDKKDKKRSKKKRHREEDSAGEGEESSQQMKELVRNYALADALHELLTDHPTSAMAVDTLPLLLIKLGGGGAMDFRQMTDRGAAEGIQRVLLALAPFGVTQEKPQVWKWAVPGGGKHTDERILLRIVRTLLNDIGLSMEAITQQHQNQQQQQDNNEQENDAKKLASDNTGASVTQEDLAEIKDQTLEMLQSFQKKKEEEDSSAPQTSTLPGELGGLCNMILEGESIALDGLPDPKLRTALEGLFQQCGLELSEMQDSDDEEEDDDSVDDQDGTTPAMGYGLPEAKERQELVKSKLMSMMNACEFMASNPHAAASATTKASRPKGPMPMPSGYQAPEDSSDEEGPAPVGAVAKRKDPGMSKDLIKQQAEMRARQLRGAVTGQEELMSTGPNQREEWMLVPGKFDFLSSIKAGNPMKSRNFQAKSKAEGDDSGNAPVDPRVKAEMDAIMQAHIEARGPTLVEQHRLKKQQEREEKAAAAAGGNGAWTWSRDKDLDAGRRVDKNALAMVLGGANKDLKTKFQGGF